MRLLADALVDQHVRIDRHANGEDDAGDTGQRERRANQNHRCEYEQDVHGEGEIGENAENAVGRDHVDDDEDPADIGRPLACVDRILPETGPYRALLDHGELRRQGAGPEQDREAARFVEGEIAGDLPGAAGDRRANHGRRNDLAVEHDGKWPADVLRSDLPEFLSAAQIEAEGHVRLAGLLVEALLRVDQIFAVDHDALLDLDRPAAFLHWQRLDLIRRIARVGDEPEVELGGLPDDLLELRRVLKPGHLDQHAVDALLLDHRFLGAHRVDATIEHFDRLRHGVAHFIAYRRISQGQLDSRVGLGHLEAAPVAGGQRAADRLAQRLQQREGLFAIPGVRDADEHAARLGRDAARQRDFSVAHFLADVVAERVDLGFDD